MHASGSRVPLIPTPPPVLPVCRLNTTAQASALHVMAQHPEHRLCPATDAGLSSQRSGAASVQPLTKQVLQAWVRKRLLRASAIHGLAGMAAIMASTYKAYLGEGLGPLSWIQKFKIPHPGRVGPASRCLCNATSTLGRQPCAEHLVLPWKLICLALGYMLVGVLDVQQLPFGGAAVLKEAGS